jgi:hypothetical protein
MPGVSVSRRREVAVAVCEKAPATAATDPASRHTVSSSSSPQTSVIASRKPPAARAMTTHASPAYRPRSSRTPPGSDTRLKKPMRPVVARMRAVVSSNSPKSRIAIAIRALVQSAPTSPSPKIRLPLDTPIRRWYDAGPTVQARRARLLRAGWSATESRSRTASAPSRRQKSWPAPSMSQAASVSIPAAA